VGLLPAQEALGHGLRTHPTLLPPPGCSIRRALRCYREAAPLANALHEHPAHTLSERARRRRELVTAAVIQDLGGPPAHKQFALTVLPDLPLQHALVRRPLPLSPRPTIRRVASSGVSVPNSQAAPV
jgi:hypothetical protein